MSRLSDTLPVKIKIGPTAVESRIEIGLVDMSRFVTGFELQGAVGEITQLTVHFIKVDVEVDGFVDATAIGDAFKNYVKAREIKEGAHA